MKYRVVLIDDETLAIKRMEKLLKSFEHEIEIVAKATNGEDAIREIDALKPDLIFLDIQMPEINGFEVLERIKHKPFVIFSTAYDVYALRAFETNSIDYLLKPVDSKRLRKAIDKLKHLRGDKVNEFQQQLQKMLKEINLPTHRIQVKTGDRIKLLDPGNIYFFLSDEKYTRIQTYDRSYLIDTSLNALEEDLDECFIRVHRKAIINLNHMDEIIRMFKGSYHVKMKNKEGTELPVSRQSKHKLGL